MGVSTQQATATTRILASDERGVGLRATWRPRFGFINLSLWSDRRCVETFHLTPEDAARLVGFLADSLASVAPEPHLVPLRMMPIPAARPETEATSTVEAATIALRRRTAVMLEDLARRLRT